MESNGGSNIERPSWYRPPAETVEPARETAAQYVRRFMVRRAKRVAGFALGYGVVIGVHEYVGIVTVTVVSR